MSFICGRKKKKVYPVHTVCKSIHTILTIMSQTLGKTRKQKRKMDNLIRKTKQKISKMPEIEIKHKLESTIRRIEKVASGEMEDILVTLFAVKQLRTLPNYFGIKYKQRYWT